MLSIYCIRFIAGYVKASMNDSSAVVVKGGAFSLIVGSIADITCVGCRMLTSTV